MSIGRVQTSRFRARPPTIRDVADTAGVSVGTVSKALKGEGQLHDETRAAVHRAARALRFRPSEMARSLFGQRCFTVGLVSTDRHGRFSIPVLEGIEDTLDAARISAFLCNTAGDPAR
jgi:LacI family transcriptional regulator